FIAPVYEQLSNQYLNAKFLKVDVDKARDVMQQYGVRAMPTFVFLKNKIEVERVQGANPDALVAAITKHYSSAPSNPDAANPLERQFLQQFAAVSRSTAEYLDEISKTLALSLVPEEELRTKATIKGTLNHFLLAKLLLKWFKESFFKWTDSPICKKCGTQTDKNGGLQGTPNHEELENGAGRVEIYQCKNCDCEVRFPRYNKPARLLETRNGRCGEFANCFTLIAAAMGFNVRYIYDVTDHVWVELFIPGADRWVHCDPCENIIDQPLLYEKGWGKNLSYVLAFGTDHVYDVTWRYSLDHKKTLKRRNRCREVVLARFIEKLNERYQKNMTPERKTELVKRRIREIVEFLVIGPRKDTSQNLGGRTTGSEEWRRARGELGEQVGCSTNCATTLLTPEQEAERAMAEVKIEPKFVFTPTEEEITNGSFKIEYSVVKDEYKRGTDVKKDFSSWVYEAKNMQRKVEADWKMAYLCRNEGTNDAEIMWSIDLSQVKAKQVKISMKGCEKFESGSVDAMVCSGDMCMIVRKGELIFDDVPQAVVKITVNLSGGEGENAFQHAQLFRSKLDDQAPQLVVEINFK
ncbi:hypothetical protein WR25_03563, partial [Diploscapter pachys]